MIIKIIEELGMFENFAGDGATSMKMAIQQCDGNGNSTIVENIIEPNSRFETKNTISIRHIYTNCTEQISLQK